MRPMKESGIAWIGKIPQEWEIRRIGYLYEQRLQKVSDEEYEPLSVTKQGIFPQLEHIAKSDAHEDRKLVCKFDFVINSRSDRRGSCGISNYDGSVSLINTVLVSRSEFSYYYCGWLFKSSGFADEFYKWGHGIVADLWTTNWQDMKKINIPFPPLPEQQAIADKLDRVCGEIDNVIAKTKAVVEEYKKLKQAIITEAVTGEKQCGMRNSQCGIKEKRPMKDSGIEWIGQIPQEWEVTKVKRFYQVTLGKMLQPIQQYDDETFENYLCAMNVNNCLINYFDLKQMWFSEVEKYELVLKQGDLIVVEGGDVGDCAIINEDVNNLYFQNALHRVRIKNDMVSKVMIGFLMYQIINAKNSGHIDLICNKATIAHFTKEKLQNLTFLFPPLPEQQAIVAYLDAKCGAIDELIAKKQQLITEMENYKKSVIYEYVTGKKEVG